MKVRIYTDKEIEKLNQCIFVRKIKYRREIEYDPIFKLWSIMMRLEFPNLSASEIFGRAGFDTSILHHKLPQRRIKEWLDNYKKFGINYFLPEDEYYYTIREKKNEINQIDSFRSQLLKIVLDKLKEYENEINR